MKTDYLKKALLDFTDLLEFQLCWFQLNENLKIRAEDCVENDWETPEETIIKQFSFIAIFYGKEYEFSLPKKYIDEDYNGTSYMSGDGDLMSSLEELLEDDLWEHLKMICTKYAELVLADNLSYA